MCRHLAYLGPQVTLRSVLTDPPYGLLRQSWAPRQQKHGTVNADGFGVGWYAAGDPVPARYRRAVPMWGDASFADLVRVTRTRALLAAVRSATDGTAQVEAAAAPYAAGPWLFSHNGTLDGWPDATAGLAATLPAAELLALEARADSALAWALVLHRLRAGEGPADAPLDDPLAGEFLQNIREAAHLVAMKCSGRKFDPHAAVSGLALKHQIVLGPAVVFRIRLRTSR